MTWVPPLPFFLARAHGPCNWTLAVQRDMSKRPLLSGVTKASAARIQGLRSAPRGRFMNAAQAEARARPHSWVVSARGEGVEVLGFEAEEGANGRGRTGKERAAHTRHGGETEKYWAMFNSHSYLFTPVPACASAKLSQFLSATSSPRSSVSVVSPQRRADTVTQPLNFPSRHSTGEKSCCCCCCCCCC